VDLISDSLLKEKSSDEIAYVLPSLVPNGELLSGLATNYILQEIISSIVVQDECWGSIRLVF